jgi:hypothetical protein
MLLSLVSAAVAFAVDTVTIKKEEIMVYRVRKKLKQVLIA